MKVGTKSVLFGAHQFLLHPLFVAAAWTKLYGVPTDPRLWAAFFVHDIGYVGKPNMDGAEGEGHVWFGADLMHRWFDRPCSPDFLDSRHKHFLCEDCNRWLFFCLYHSRFFAKRDNHAFSRLCVADKLSVALEPWWLYLPRIILSGEIHEYMALAGGKGNSKYKGQPNSKYVSMQIETGTVRGWHRGMTSYLRDWAETHRDGRDDTWTPALGETL